jgi:hypothetical protein
LSLSFISDRGSSQIRAEGGSVNFESASWVLVVGCGSSAMEIAHNVAAGGAARVWMAVRTPPNIMMRSGPGGLPGDVIATPLYHLPPPIADRIARRARLRAIGDLTKFGLPIPDEGPFSRSARLGVAPALVDMAVINAIKVGVIEVVKSPGSFDGSAVSLVDGSRSPLATRPAASAHPYPLIQGRQGDSG